MAHVAMTQVGLDQAKIGAAVGEVVPAGMPEHVRMDGQGRKSSSCCHAVQHKLCSSRRHGSATFGDENEIPGLGTFPLQPPKRPNFHSPQALVAIHATFRSVHVENPLLKVELCPAGIQAFPDAQSMGEQNKDKGAIPVAPPVLSCRFDKLLHFGKQEMLPIPQPAHGDCSLYGNWHHVSHRAKLLYFERVARSNSSQKVQNANSYQA
jgi:hypothetical protein